MDIYSQFFELIGELARKRYLIAEREFGHLSLNHTEARLLSLLNENNGCKQETLSEFIVIDRTNIGRALKHLQEQGYIIKEKDNQDKRSFRVFITDQGRELTKRIYQIKQVIIQEFCKGISENDMKTIVEILKNNKNIG